MCIFPSAIVNGMGGGKVFLRFQGKKPGVRTTFSRQDYGGIKE
jgi:hypothetical protein